MILALLPLSLHCGGHEDQKPTLDVVSNQITFKSVERLGSHHMLATIRLESAWPDGDTEQHEETVELAWNDWDNFHLRRVVRGADVGETLVEQGQVYNRVRGPTWQKETDAEPARLRVRTSWKVWDSAMEVFTGRVKLTEAEKSVVDGRPARRFKVSLAPLKAGQRIGSGAMVPKSIEGEVWLDEGTAVRLAADVKAVVEHKGMVRTVHLHLRRGGIGQAQTITPPQQAVISPPNALQERLRKRRPRAKRPTPGQRKP